MIRVGTPEDVLTHFDRLVASKFAAQEGCNLGAVGYGLSKGKEIKVVR